jgi:alkylated DNA repair dioxygenase AlkB
MSPRRKAASSSEHELSLFADGPPLPDGFLYGDGLITQSEEAALLERIAALPLKQLDFHGYTARRRTISFGRHYDFSRERLDLAAELPDWLLPLRARAASFAGLAPEALPHVLILEYSPGSTIGWHRDKAVFGDVIGISLRSACRFRFRRKAGERWERADLTLDPRSAYLLRGPSRTEWEHSIPAVDALRYSITFRTLAPERRD